jgi:RES domain-containing protein
MRLWRLSEARYARVFNGGYGLAFDGRWNTRGRPVTYCSTVASLCALEKRVHVMDPGLLPAQFMVEYEADDNLPRTEIELRQLPVDWLRREPETQRLGNDWLDRQTGALLIVPSAIIAISSAPDRNVLINHRHSAAAAIRVVDATPFTFDPRLFRR